MAWETRKKSGEAPPRGEAPPSTDDNIRNDIRSRLADDPGLDATDIEVRVNSGQVILEGTVPSEMARQMAEIVAYEAEGVRGVENTLVIRARKRRDAPQPPTRRDRENPIEPGTDNYLEAAVSPQQGSIDSPYDPDNRPGIGTGGTPADTSGSPLSSGVNLKPGPRSKTKAD